MNLNRSWLMTLCVVGMGALLILPSLGFSIGSLVAFLLVSLPGGIYDLAGRNRSAHGGLGHGEA